MSIGRFLRAVTGGLRLRCAADPDAAPRQRLAQQNLDLGVDAAQVGFGASFHRIENRFLGAER